jgi:hypothetical protein
MLNEIDSLGPVGYLALIILIFVFLFILYLGMLDGE